MVRVLLESIESFDGTVAAENACTAAFAEAAVLLFVKRLVQEGGFTNDQTVYPYSIGFRPADFIAVRPSAGSGLESEYDFEFIRLGCAAMLLADVKDELSEECVDEDVSVSTGDDSARAALERSSVVLRAPNGALVSAILNELERPSRSRNYAEVFSRMSALYAELVRMAGFLECDSKP